MNLISHKFRAIFIHIEKNAGTSIISELDKALHGYPGRGNEKFRVVHIQEWRERRKKEFEEYFKFCFVRNPWDRLVSGYFYLQPRLKKIPQIREFPDFESFALGFYKMPEIINHPVFMPQHRFITEDGKIFVDYVGRFENLEVDFRIVCGRIGLFPPLKLSYIRESGYGGMPHKNYRCYYNDEMIRTVAEVFKEDIHMFGYVFDGKNWNLLKKEICSLVTKAT